MLSSRFSRRSALSLLCMVTGVCTAQPGKPQFVLPKVEPTGGQVASFLVGPLQEPQNAVTNDFFYINAPVVSGGSASVTVGELLSNLAGGFNNLLQNQITFPNVSNAVAALADFNGDQITDYIFALTPTIAGAPNLCIYYGSGGGFVGSSYSGPGPPPSHYPPAGGKSGCMTFPATGSNSPNFAYIATPSYKTNLVPELMIEDSANNLVYLFSNSGGNGFGGGLPNISLNSTLAIPAADGGGPIYVADLNHDQNTDIVINGQTGYSALVYLGNGDGTFQPPVRYTFDHHVHSLLLQDMDGDGYVDMVVEGDNGVIEIFHNNRDGTFGLTSIGGTVPGVDGITGHGGHLAAIGGLGKDSTPHIFVTTPIGLSVLQTQPGSLSYTLNGIYNIGPGRTSFALGDFNGDSYNDLAVDSAEGVAIALGDGLGGSFFQTSLAYTTLAPALGSVVGKFRTTGNPNGNLDVAVNTGTYQGQLLTGNGNGTFTTYPGTLVPIGLSVSPNVWSNLLTGDFNGDGIPDIAYSLTGLPAAPLISVSIQYGNGNGTFTAPAGINPRSAGLPVSNTLFGESTVADFSGDGIADIANADAANDDTLLGQSSSAFSLGLNQAVTNSNFSQVAAGFFKSNRTSKQDLVFQQGANLIPYLNSGDGKHFTAMPALAGTPSPALLVTAAVLLADLDNDGNGDVVAVYYNPNPNPVGAGPVAPNQLYIWYGNGDGTFGQPQITALTRNDDLAAVGDMNHDGLPDILLADGSLVTVLYNQGARIFGGEQHFLAGQGINSLSVADVNGDGQADLIVANGGATLSNPLALGGATKASISLPANPDVNTGGITVLVNNIQTQPVTGTLVATPEPSALAATFTLTATITPSAGVATPTGFVSFFIDGSPVGNGAPIAVTTAAGVTSASVVIPAGNTYATGIHTVTAFYTGDANNSSLPLNGTHAIGAGLTTTQLFLCVGPTPACPTPPAVISPAPPYVANLTMAYGQEWNGILDTFANDGSALTGTVSINDVYNGTSLPAICTVPVTGGACGIL